LKVSKNCTHVPKRKILEKEKEENGSPFRERMEVGGKKIDTKCLPIPEKRG
jgi:hypothetical protein